mmetsp:Transcript_98543/g.261882  ORF Transcript_98543/g.261882 Transcript_98543/m.261882 type:complete len:207 (-) Transcript_98543:561-1181(-)
MRLRGRRRHRPAARAPHGHGPERQRVGNLRSRHRGCAARGRRGGPQPLGEEVHRQGLPRRGGQGPDRLHRGCPDRLRLGPHPRGCAQEARHEPRRPLQDERRHREGPGQRVREVLPEGGDRHHREPGEFSRSSHGGALQEEGLGPHEDCGHHDSRRRAREQVCGRGHREEPQLHPHPSGGGPRGGDDPPAFLAGQGCQDHRGRQDP